jgi:two-component system sensor histidine kinase KdpD
MPLTDNTRIREFLAPAWRQYMVATGVVAGVSAAGLALSRWVDYQTLALIYLVAQVLLALVIGRGPTLFAAALSAVVWEYIFVPPLYSFDLLNVNDQMTVLTYCIVAWVVAELTARLRAHQQTELKAQLLSESEKLGRTLLNSVSHEFRTPISAILGAAGNLRAEGGLSSSQERFIGEIESAGGRLNRIVQSLLSAARLQGGQLRPRMDWCEIRDVINASLRESAGLLKGHPVETRIAAGSQLAKMDFVLMQQALSNLIANAAIHTPPGTPIEISARMEGKEMLLQVADRGPGLPAGDLEHVFDLFHRLPNSKPGGVGLGLAIVLGFVEAQGGRVAAANGVNGGAIFNIWMPAADRPELPEETP